MVGDLHSHYVLQLYLLISEPVPPAALFRNSWVSYTTYAYYQIDLTIYHNTTYIYQETKVCPYYFYVWNDEI